MKYTYLVHRDVWIEVEIDAEDEDAAQEEYERMSNCGELDSQWRDEALVTESEVAEVRENGKRIYAI